MPKPRLLLSLLFLVIIATLVNSRLFVSQTLAAYFLFTIAATAFAITSGILLIKYKNALILKPSLSTLLFLLFGFNVFADVILQAGWGNSRHWYLIICILFYFSLIAGFALKELQPNKILLLIIVPAIFEALFCLGQHYNILSSFNHYFTVTGTWSNPNVTAMFLAMCITLALPVLEGSNKTPKYKLLNAKFLSLLYILLLFTAIMLLQCRTAIIGAVVNIFVYAFVRYGIVQKLFSKKHLALKIVIAICAIGLLEPVASKMYKAKQSSADGRLLVWKISAQMIADKPMFGFGYGNFEREYNRYQGQYFKSGRGTANELENAGHVKMAYNEFLENAVEGGSVGLILFAALLVSLLVKGFKGLQVQGVQFDQSLGKRKGKSISLENSYNFNNTIQMVAFAGICAFAVMSVVNFTIQAVPVMCVFIIYAAMLHYKPKEDSLHGSETSTNKILKNIYALSSIALALFFLLHQSTYGKAHLQLKQAINKYYQKDKNQIAVLKNIGRYLKKSDNYHIRYAEILKREGSIKDALLQYNLALGLTSDPDVFIKRAQCHWKLNNLAQAEHDLQQALYIQPGLFEPRFALMNLYINSGNDNNAMEMAKSIVSMTPKIPSKQINFYKQKAKQFLTQNK